MRLMIAAALLAAGAASATPAAAETNPAKIRITPASSKGAMLIRVPVLPFDYSLSFSKNGSSGFLSRVYQMRVRAGPPGYTYIANSLSPGRYRLDSIWQQGAWSACLEQGTVEFPVVAGRIGFVGTLQVVPVMEAIQRHAIERGRTTVQGTDYVMARPDIDRPVVDGRDEAGLADARSFADEAMNGSGSLVGLGDVNEATFGTSRAGRAIKICG